MTSEDLLKFMKANDMDGFMIIGKLKPDGNVDVIWAKGGINERTAIAGTILAIQSILDWHNKSPLPKNYSDSSPPSM